jgi:hypothetical protein
MFKNFIFNLLKLKKFLFCINLILFYSFINKFIFFYIFFLKWFSPISSEKGLLVILSGVGLTEVTLGLFLIATEF